MWTENFKRFFLNNKFVVVLLVMLLVGLNVMVFTRISFVFSPLFTIAKTVMLPIILAGIAYYLLNPVVNYLEHRKVKRTYSILALYLIISGLITLIMLLVIPNIQEQIRSISREFPRYLNEVEHLFYLFMDNPLLNQLQQSIQWDYTVLWENLSSYGASLLDNAFSNIGAALGAVTEVILAIVTLPFILYYLLKDGKKLPDYFLRFLPTRVRTQTHTIMSDMNHQISSYIRGQIIVSFCIGILLYIGYLVIGLEYSLTLATIAAFTSVVPYVGPAIAITPALIISIVTSPIMLLKMVIVWTIVQLVEGKFITPQIMGRNLHVHPITIIFVILTAGNLFGIIGILLAVPGYVLLKVVITHTFNWIKLHSNLYK